MRQRKERRSLVRRLKGRIGNFGSAPFRTFSASLPKRTASPRESVLWRTGSLSLQTEPIHLRPIVGQRQILQECSLLLPPCHERK